MPETKKCSRCGEEKELTKEYYRVCSDSVTGYSSACRVCLTRDQTTKREHAKSLRPEKVIPTHKACTKCMVVFENTNEFFYNRKTGSLISVCKTCSNIYGANNYSENRDAFIKKHAEYYSKNKDKLKPIRKKWKENNKEKSYKKSRESIASNIERYRKAWIVYSKQRRTAKKGLSATLTGEQWDRIVSKFNRRCAYCGEEKLLCRDHFIPLTGGGELTTNNIIPACGSCNSSKGNRDPFIWYTTYRHFSKKRWKAILKFLCYDENGIQQLKMEGFL